LTQEKAVHPHGRGDNTSSNVLTTRYLGSPPRAWGQSRNDAALLEALRFTPTGVGTIAAK